MPWWGWLVIGAMLLGAEIIVTTDFYLAVLGVAALSVGLVSALGLETPWMQWALFGVKRKSSKRRASSARSGSSKCPQPRTAQR